MVTVFVRLIWFDVYGGALPSCKPQLKDEGPTTKPNPYQLGLREVLLAPLVWSLAETRYKLIYAMFCIEIVVA